MSVSRLPPYPSTQTRKSLSPSQLVTVNQTISSSLLQTLALPTTKRDTPATRAFVSSYTKDAALQVLGSLIWEGQIPLSKDDKIIRKRSLLLAEKLASSPPGLDVQTLLDIAIIYGSTNSSQARQIFTSALISTPSLVSTFQSEVVPAFTLLLSPSHSSGLYALRKTAHCISSLLRVSPSESIRSFAHNKDFVLALANAYDQGLASIAHSYGGMHLLQQAETRELDEWERIWVETKVALMDAFHVLLSTLLNDISAASGITLASESERTFDVIFNLLELPSSSSSSASTNLPSIPFLNRSLLADYQQSYDLSHTLASALRHAAEKDARIDLLESTLLSLEQTPRGGTNNKKDAGVLKLLLRSSGIPPGVDNIGKGKNHHSSKANKGKAKATPNDRLSPMPVYSSFTPPADHHIDPDIDIKVIQVLDILPEQSPSYIRTLLVHAAYPFRGSAEKVVEALLEGTAPAPEELEGQGQGEKEHHDGGEELVYVKDRRNVFDDEDMILSQVRVGKKRGEDEAVLRDRTFIEQMKAEILRRAEEISDDDDDDDGDGRLNGKGKRNVGVAFEEELDLDGAGRVKILGDGEESNEDDHEDENGDEEGEEVAQLPPRQTSETVLEMAYLEDPKLFERDGQTRRNKSRADLKARTGWTDEQIEGWKIMLERNPKKDKILLKHEFAGNRVRKEGGDGHVDSSDSQGPSHGGNNDGRGRGGRGRGGRGRGGGAGRGGGGGPNGDGGNARERAWKDKNKASRGNHNRKKGHDKKMARGGGPSA